MKKPLSKKDKTDYLKQLKPADLKLLQEVKTNYGKMSANALMKHTYINFPFYAIKSEVAESILSQEELEKVTKAKPKGNKTVLFTIGYEGISLEEYLVRLLKNDVKFW
jgi:exonuclease III